MAAPIRGPDPCEIIFATDMTGDNFLYNKESWNKNYHSLYKNIKQENTSKNWLSEKCTK